MVRDKCPCITLGLCFLKDHSESFQKGSANFIVCEDFSAFDPPGHYVLQDTGGIKSGLTGHVYLR